MRFYAKSVADAVYLTHFLGDYGRDDLDAALTGLLKMARSVAAAYYGHPDGLEINASVMVAVPIRSRRRADYPGLVFTGPRWTPDAYQRVLLLRQWAEQSNRVPQDVALPVHRSPPRVLFGAPRAFQSGQAQAVGDVKDPEELTRLLDSQPEAVAAEIRDYMARAPFRSFVSWCLPYRDRPVGVLNIQSSEPNLFGDSSRYGDEIAVYLQPLCYVLGLVIAALGAG